MNISDKVIKGSVIVIGIIAALVVAAHVLMYEIAKPKIEARIEETIQKNLGPDYHFFRNEYDFSVFDRSLGFTDVYIARDSIIKGSEGNFNYSYPGLYAYIPELRINGIHLFKVFFSDEITINRIHFEKPVIAQVAGDSMKEHGKSSSGKQVLIKKITVDEGSFKRFQPEGDTISEKLVVQSFDLQVTDLATQPDTAKTGFTTENIAIQAKNASFKSPNETFDIKLFDITASEKKSQIIIDSLGIHPFASKHNYAKAHGNKSKTWINLTNNRIVLHGISFPDLLQRKTLRANFMELEGLTILAYKDKRYPQPQDLKRMPQEVLREMKTPVDIDSMEIKNGYFQYEEMPPEGTTAGKVIFTGVYAKIYNLVNIPEKLAENSVAKVIANGHVMGKSLMKTNTDFYITSPENRFHSKGSVSSMSLTQLNPLAVPVGYVRIQEGHLNKAYYNMHGNGNGASGDLRFYYNNLKIELLDKQKLDSGFWDEVKSFIGNKVVLESSNPEEGEEVRIAEMNFPRSGNRSFFFLFWKTLFSGIRESVGAGFMNKTETETEKVDKDKDKKKKEKDKKDDDDDDEKGFFDKIF